MRPAPILTDDNAAFWDAAREHRLVAQRCASCRRLRHPPRPMCPQCRSLDVELVDLSGRGTVYSFSIIHYPPTPPSEAGVNAHHDTGFLTLLWQHGVAGLQVQNQRGDWIDVPADDDAVVVNLGEMLQAMTGNYFVATTHRVVATQER